MGHAQDIRIESKLVLGEDMGYGGVHVGFCPDERCDGQRGGACWDRGLRAWPSNRGPSSFTGRTIPWAGPRGPRARYAHHARRLRALRRNRVEQRGIEPSESAEFTAIHVDPRTNDPPRSDVSARDLVAFGPPDLEAPTVEDAFAGALARDRACFPGRSPARVPCSATRREPPADTLADEPGVNNALD